MQDLLSAGLSRLAPKDYLEYEPALVRGDAKDLSFLDDDSIHLIIAHPSYWNVVKTSDLEGI